MFPMNGQGIPPLLLQALVAKSAGLGGPQLPQGQRPQQQPGSPMMPMNAPEMPQAQAPGMQPLQMMQMMEWIKRNKQQGPQGLLASLFAQQQPPVVPGGGSQ